MKKNYYELLKISTNSTKEEILNTYEVMAKTLFEGISKDRPISNDMFELVTAYKVLSNDQTRKGYDSTIGYWDKVTINLRYQKDHNDDLNYYELLNVQSTASKVEIMASFREGSEKMFPFINNKEYPQIQNYFLKVIKAYHVLIDDKSRHQYDELLIKQNEYNQEKKNNQPHVIVK